MSATMTALRGFAFRSARGLLCIDDIFSPECPNPTVSDYALFQHAVRKVSETDFS